MIKIKTLTPIHIGNGQEIQGNFEYLYFKDEGMIAVVDAEKVLKIIGEENISHWVSCIENNQSLMSLLQTRRPSVKAEEVASRLIPIKFFVNKPIREQIHSGTGSVLLPGSSLKGAVRTAFWANWLEKNEEYAQDVRNFQNYGKWSDKVTSSRIFGKDPNHDIFRLLQISDVTFSETEVLETNVVNTTRDGWAIKREVTQFVEAIPSGSTAYMKFFFNETLFEKSGSLFNSSAKNLKLESLFPLINDHTRNLVSSIVDDWNEKGNPDVIGSYLEDMEHILDTIESCSSNECVLRLGWGSGFLFMTGDWHISMEEEDYSRLVQTLRPRYNNSNLVFPKSFRIVKGGTPLGFVKLSY
jgi:CRISPR type III-A-associated RAMP protein Csm5